MCQYQSINNSENSFFGYGLDRDSQ